MNKKKIISFILSLCLCSGFYSQIAYAEDDSGNIDLYQVFSSKEDRMKNEVGSRIYKWSMHLPDDGIIYKSEKANVFYMSTSSYQASIQLVIDKNKDDLTLEQLLYQMQTQSKSTDYNSYVDGGKEFVIDIETDSAGQKYIRVIKLNESYDYYTVSDEESGDYTENRIYISNNYIYDLTVSMNGKFYVQHNEMFTKLVTSFKLSFDDKNPYIKELSDSVSSSREYRNTNYGWKIMMSPYWRVKGTPNSRTQDFNPVYSDEELSSDRNEKKDFKVEEGVTVALIGSAGKNETTSEWTSNELVILKNNYSSETFEILSNEAKSLNGFEAQGVIIRYNTVTNNPYIVHSYYIIGNGYKYIISATMMEEKYKDESKKREFEEMLNSFTLDKKYLSSYMGKIISAKEIADISGDKNMKMQKFDFQAVLSRGWNVVRSLDGTSYNNNVSNSEVINAFEPTSNTVFEMTAKLDTSKMSESVKLKTDLLLKDDEVRMGLAKVKIQSAEYEGAQLYYIEKEYDINAIKEFIKNDPTKIYDFEQLYNQYDYIIKIGKDTYTESAAIPVAHMTYYNKSKLEAIWKSTFINKIKYSQLNLQWKQHKLEEFDVQKKF